MSKVNEMCHIDIEIKLLRNSNITKQWDKKNALLKEIQREESS